MNTKNPVQALIWCIALPGFGQFLNQQFFKGFVLMFLELIVNMGSGLNSAIISSFHGNTELAIKQADLQWLMFYPCLYMFGMWDAYKDAGGGKSPYASIPFVMGAFSATVGVIYSPTATIIGFLLGPVWLPMLFCLIGIGLGIVIRALLIKISV